MGVAVGKGGQGAACKGGCGCRQRWAGQYVGVGVVVGKGGRGWLM